MTFNGLNAKEAKAFAEEWLPAWTGNHPEQLMAFYTEDAFYSDPVIPKGLQGKAAILAYFKKLLQQNPNWVWTHHGSTPLENGFVNRWQASIPVGSRQVEVTGICLVQLHEGKIYSNEVFFDRTELLQAIQNHRK